MSSDGELNKTNQSETDEKEKMDTTDSSQDSVVKSECEDEKDEKKDDKKDAKADTKSDEKEQNKVKEEKAEKSTKENDVEKKEKKEDVKNNKEAKKEEKSEDDTEEGDDDEEDEDDDKKEVPLLDQPLEQSGTRERKKVQRFNEEFPTEAKEATKVEIPEGTGISLGDIPRIDASISRFKTDDLKLLHRLLFKSVGKTTLVKKNIKKFNGFDFKKDSDAYSKKVASVQKMEVKQLKIVCEMLDLEKSGKKEEICDRICEFLLEPKDSGKPVGGGRPKRTAAVRANNRGYSSHDDEDDSDTGKRSSRSRRGKGKRVNLKDESSSESDAEFNPDNESDEEMPRVNKTKAKRGRASKKQDSEEEISDVEESASSDELSDEPKGKRKRAVVTPKANSKTKKAKTTKSPAKKTPAKNKKSEAGKKNAANKRKAKEESEDEEDEEEEDEKENSEKEESSSGDDEPLVKKTKSPQPPTDDEIKTYVKEILEGANLEEITMKTVCKQVYAHYPDFDLAHKKDFIKSTVKSLIST